MLKQHKSRSEPGHYRSHPSVTHADLNLRVAIHMLTRVVLPNPVGAAINRELLGQARIQVRQ